MISSRSGVVTLRVPCFGPLFSNPKGCFKKYSRVFEEILKCILVNIGGVARSIDGVSRKFQRSFKEVSRVFQESFRGISRKSQGCFKEDGRVFQGNFRLVSRVVKKFKTISGKIGRFEVFSRKF